jgi:hypothetical protein
MIAFSAHAEAARLDAANVRREFKAVRKAADIEERWAPQDFGRNRGLRGT